jgi:hypothetical protein
VSIPEVSSRSRLIAFLQSALKKLNSLTIGNYTFPTSDGTNNQVLTTDGDGILTFENAGAGGGISWDGSTANGVATYKDANEATVEANLTFDGSTLDVSGDVDIASGQYLRTNGIAAVGSSGNEVQFGSAATDKTLALRTDVGTVLSIDAAGVVTFDVAPAAGTDNTVLIINSSNEIVRDNIDSKVWAGDLVDYTGTPVNNQVAIWTDTDTLEGDSGLTFDGNTLTVAEPTGVDTLILGRATGQANIKAASSEHMIIDSDGQYLSLNHYEDDNVVLGYGGGNVGVGPNSSPAHLLTVATDVSAEAVASVTQYNNSSVTDGPNILLQRARGTMASPTIVQDGDTIGSLRWYSYDGSNFDLSAGIMAEVDGTPGSNDTPGRLLFRTTADGSNSLTERMRIDSTGLVTVAGDLTVDGANGIKLGASTSYIKDASGHTRISIIDAGAMTLYDSGGGTEFSISNNYVTVDGDLRVNDFARIDALRVGTTTTDPGDGNLVVEGTPTLGGAPASTGQRAEFLDTGGGTYAGYNGAYWGGSQASSANANTVLTASGQQYDMLGPGQYTTSMYHYGISATPASTAGNVRRFTDGSSANNFTGQHNVSPADSQLVENLEDNIGLIVVANGSFKRYDERPSVDAWVTGKEAITIAEALPIVELAAVPNDKRAFGVISNRPNEYLVDTETGEYEEDQDGIAKGFGNIHSEQVRINSIGEGAIWVCNISGNLENGDYITTCEIPGLGMKQDDDLLHNYTVAKITQDCDFRINASNYNVVEFEYSGSTYRKAFVGCTYHCG